MPSPPAPTSPLRRRALGGIAIAAPAIAAILGLSLARRSPPAPLPRLASSGAVEGCLACHAAVEGLGPAHDPAEIGCSPCHLGDPEARDEAGAHRGIERLPGDFSTLYATCGRGPCHVIEAARVTSSLMARAPGILAVDRFAFGERDSPYGEDHDGLDAQDPTRPGGSPAVSHARKLCASCHLGARKETTGDQGFFSRGGGCAACHLAPPWARRAQRGGPLHPDVSAAVAEQRCAGCHARSGRIALSYRGVVELEPGDPRVTGALPDGRPTGALAPDVHARAGMTCIDCHTEQEIMGDGAKHRHAHEALEIRCADCHAPGPRPAPAPEAARVEPFLRRSWERRGLAPLPAGPPLRTSRGTPLVRTDAPARMLVLSTTGERRAIPEASAAAYHRLTGHERLDCQACHAAWAPRCTTCHTVFDPAGEDVDHVSGEATAGRWIEEAGGNGFGPPLLAVGPRGTIATFVEGMSLRLDGIEGLGDPYERSLFAPLDPHTTGKARPCPSCHAEDAIDAVLPVRGETTRTSARLLDPRERAAVAAVGRCLRCHTGYDDGIYQDFRRSLDRQRARAPGTAACEGAPR